MRKHLLQKEGGDTVVEDIRDAVYWKERYEIERLEVAALEKKLAMARGYESCERCGNECSNYLINPYLEATHDMISKEWLCDSCYKDLLQSI